MARDALPLNSDGGVYGWQRERADEKARHSMPRPGHRQCLAALRAGTPVDVRAGELPAWARGETTRWWRQATVRADGAVTFWDDDGSTWLAEHGL
jgi:hypothetical protein